MVDLINLGWMLFNYSRRENTDNGNFLGGIPVVGSTVVLFITVDGSMLDEDSSRLGRVGMS